MSIYDYSEARDLLNAIIKKSDYALAELFILNIYPALSNRNQEDIRNYSVKSVMESDDSKMHEVFIKHFGMDQDDAHNYINARLIDRKLDRALLESAVRSLGEYYGASLFNAIRKGDIEVIQEIEKQHGIKKVNVKYSHRRLGSFVDNKSVDGQSKISVENAAELRKVVRYAYQAGILEKNIEGEYPVCLFDEDHLSLVAEQFPEEVWDHTPIIKAGVVANGEIISAFAKQCEDEIGKSIHKRLPVFVHKDFAGRLSTANLFVPKCEVSVYSGNLTYGATREKFPNDYHDYSAANPDESLFTLMNAQGEIYINRLDKLNFTIEGKSDDELSDLDESLISEILPAVYRYGFCHQKDYVLAVVDVEELKKLHFKEFSTSILEKAEQYAGNFFPPNLVEANFCVSNWRKIKANPIGYRNGSVYAGELFNDLCTNEKLANAFFETLDKRIINEILDHSWHMRPSALGFIQRTLGVTTPKAIRLSSPRQALELESSGFKFNNVCSGVSKEFNYEPTIESEAALIRMGTWPDSTIPKPADLLEGLKAVVRRPDNKCLRAYVSLEGIEAVCKVAKTEAQWNMVQSIFPDETDMILKHGPRKMRRDIVAGDFEL